VNRCHAALQLRCQIPATEVDIEEGGFDAAMTSESGDLMEIPPCTCQIRQAEMAEGVGGALGHSGALSYLMDDFGPGPNGDRLCPVAPGLRYKQAAWL
jgi:hypothetical protein